LFGGEYGRELKLHGLATTGSGTVVPCAWSGDSWSGLIGAMTSGRDRVGLSGSGFGTIGSGVGGNDNNWNSNSTINHQELPGAQEKKPKINLKNI